MSKLSPLTKTGWFGHVTLDNIDEIKAHIEQLLNGKFYSFVYNFQNKMDLRTSQTLRELELKKYPDGVAHLTIHHEGIFWVGIGDFEKLYIEFKTDGFYLMNERERGQEKFLIEWLVKVEDHS